MQYRLGMLLSTCLKVNSGRCFQKLQGVYTQKKYCYYLYRVMSNTVNPAWWIGHRHYTKSDIYKMTQSGNLQIISFYIRGGIIDAVGKIIYYMNTWFFRNKESVNMMLDMARDFDYARDQGFTTLFGIIKCNNT